MCAHIRVRACVCARVCKRVPVCAGRGRPGAAGSEDAGWRGLNASGAASRVSRAPPGTRACGHVAVPPPPASQSPERGVCSPTGLVRRGVRRGGLGARLRAWGRGVPPPARSAPTAGGARGGVPGPSARRGRGYAALFHPGRATASPGRARGCGGGSRGSGGSGGRRDEVCLNANSLKFSASVVISYLNAYLCCAEIGFIINSRSHPQRLKGPRRFVH